MADLQCSCPTCGVVVGVSAAGPATCPVCDTPLPAPANTVPAPPPPVGPPPAPASRPALAGIVAAGILLFLVGGTGLAIYWFNDLDKAHAPPQQAAPGPSGAAAADPEDSRPPGVTPPNRASWPQFPQLRSVPPRTVPATHSSEPLALRVNRAIDRGVAYLKRTQQDRAQAGPGGVVGWRGPMAWRLAERTPDEGLLGLTLLSCGVSAYDPIILRLAANLRQQASRLGRTYNLSLAILFFDRLKNPSDRVLIQSLALRLVAGQNGGGDWGYNCPVLNAKQEQLLRSYLWSGAAAVLDPSALPGGRAGAPPSLLDLALTRSRGKRRVFYTFQGDNSNTQFALLALWAARRHGAPVNPALARVGRHFRKTQHADGSWAYRATGNHSRPSNSCAGLMGLAVEHGLRHWSRGRIKDAAMNKGLHFLGRTLAQARPNVPPRQRGFSGVEIQGDLYFFWSLERAAVVYGLRVIGETEWYPWAAEKIVNAQEADGSWQNAFGKSVDTCFALLVLRRTNFASDLTAALRGRIPGQDPLPSATTRRGGTPPLSAAEKPGEGPLGSAIKKVPEELSGSAIDKTPPK